MPQTATIKSLPAAFRMMKAMQAERVEWGEDYREGARHAIAARPRGRMDQLIDDHLERMVELGRADQRNGSHRRWLLTELGAIELAVPHTRTFSALRVVRAYARRSRNVDRMILTCFVLGLSTRKADQAVIKADLHRIMNAGPLPKARFGCPLLRRSLAGGLPQSGRLPARRSRRPAHLLPLSDPP